MSRPRFITPRPGPAGPFAAFKGSPGHFDPLRGPALTHAGRHRKSGRARFRSVSLVLDPLAAMTCGRAFSVIGGLTPPPLRERCAARSAGRRRWRCFALKTWRPPSPSTRPGPDGAPIRRVNRSPGPVFGASPPQGGGSCGLAAFSPQKAKSP